MVKITIPNPLSGKQSRIKISSEVVEDGTNIPTEKHLVLRLPEAMAVLVHGELKERNYENIRLEFLTDRQGIFLHRNIAYLFKLVDLPCILEAQKTIDKKQFYKSGDISQMILVDGTPLNKENEGINIEEIKENLPKLDRKDYIYPHGLTPPLHNARQNRFRKRTPKHEIETIEEQVKKLIERDNEALSTKFEIVQDDDEMSYDNDVSQLLPEAMISDDDESLVADLERDLQPNVPESDADLEGDEEMNDDIMELQSSIQKTQLDIQNAPNMIVKQMLQDQLTRYQKELATTMQTRE